MAQKRDLFTLLVKRRYSAATNERDIIYALLGLSTDALQSNPLRPDYEKSTQEVIRDAISFLLSVANEDKILLSSVTRHYLSSCTA